VVKSAGWTPIVQQALQSLTDLLPTKTRLMDNHTDAASLFTVNLHVIQQRHPHAKRPVGTQIPSSVPRPPPTRLRQPPPLLHRHPPPKMRTQVKSSSCVMCGAASPRALSQESIVRGSPLSLDVAPRPYSRPP
jgi:hypothetical protein